MMTYSIGIIGARGYTGATLLQLIDSHAGLSLAFAASRELAGRAVAEVAPAPEGLFFENLSADEAAMRWVDVCVLALPNDASAPYVAAFEAQSAETILVDLSADYRFQQSWAYGLPELYREREGLGTARRIANPGCYATAGQLSIFPVLDLLSAPPSLFGVSGYSGAGTNPSRRNDPAILKDNLLPYALSGHIHEREMSHHLRQEIRFTPHVHPAFSGLLVTTHLSFKTPLARHEMVARYRDAYQEADLISIGEEAPELRDGTNHPGVIIGGFSVSEDGLHAVVVAAEDNLLKGAAVQALQNINLVLDFAPLTGVLAMDRR